MDFSIDNIGKIASQGVGIYNQYTQQQTANDIAKLQADAVWESNNVKNQVSLSNAKLMLIGGVILAIGTAFFIFFRK